MALTDSTGFISVRSALLCSALALPSLTPTVVSAQDQAEPCMRLQQAADQIRFEESEISEDEFNQVVESNDPEQCQTWLTQVQAEGGVEGEISETEQARVRLEDEVVIEGRVIVDQGQPNVEIEEQAAEVMVGSSSPDVNVEQGPIDIVIRQGAPRISLDMPQPTITIEQPAPEIIVTMPDPSVDVSNTRPQIEVRQAEPRVQISMAEPTVELDLYQAEDPENSPGIAVENRQSQAEGESAEPQVNITRAEAQIIFEESDDQQAAVNVSRSEPSIRFEQAEPEIEITSTGDPQVNWSQSGEPNVTFEQSSTDGANTGQSGETESQSAAMSEPQNGETPSATNPDNEVSNAEASETEEQAAQSESNGPAVRREGYSGIPVDQIAASELDGATVYGVQGEEIGEVGELTLSGEEAESVVVDFGGFLGIGERRVEIPFSDLTILQGDDNGEIRVYVDATEENLDSYPEAE